jgi:hypothetical protein
MLYLLRNVARWSGPNRLFHPSNTLNQSRWLSFLLSVPVEELAHSIHDIMTFVYKFVSEVEQWIYDLTLKGNKVVVCRLNMCPETQTYCFVSLEQFCSDRQPAGHGCGDTAVRI